MFTSFSIDFNTRITVQQFIDQWPYVYQFVRVACVVNINLSQVTDATGNNEIDIVVSSFERHF